MTREEYLKMVQESPAFKGMDAETQERILAAEGADLEAYAKIFVDEENEIVAAKTEFVTTTVQVVEKFEQNTKKMVRGAEKKKEAKARQQDENESNKLLAQINDL